MRERWIFQKALEIPDPMAREAFVRRECGEDQELAKRANLLIQAAMEMGNFLESPVLPNDRIPPEEPEATETDFCPTGDAPGNRGWDRRHALEQLKPYIQATEDKNLLGKLGHYEIEQVLGQGAFGIVLAAKDLKLHRRVAIKVLSPALASTSPPRKRFLREARAAASIRHQNVVSVYAVEEEPIPYLVMELVAGVTLQDCIDQEGPLDVSDLMHFGRQLLAGLAAAHSVGVVHRDIKPSNILVEGETAKVLKVSDFGLARTVDDARLTQTGFTAGTPLYMSPEQSQGKSVDARSDLFSVASSLYAMATGRAPFRAPTTLAVLKRVSEDTPRSIDEIVPEVPEWIQAIIRKMHNKLPEHRFESAKPAFELWQACEEQWRRTGTLSPDLRARLCTAGKSEAPSAPADGRHESAPKPMFNAFRGYGWAMGGVAVLVLLSVFTQDRFGQRKVSHKDQSSSSGVIIDGLAPLTTERHLTGLEDSKQVPEAESTPLENLSANAVPVVWGQDAPPLAVIPFSSRQAEEHARQWADYLMIPLDWKHPLGIRFRLIPPGEFTMGTSEQRIESLLPHISEGPHAETCLRSESPPHRVVITEPFYLSIHEISQRQFTEVMKHNPSHFQPGTSSGSLDELPDDTGTLPVEGVTWFDAANFCRTLSRREDLASPYEIIDGTPSINDAAIGYRLPTEAEWEFACLAGSSGPYATGDDENALKGIANLGGRFGRPLPTGSLGANAFGVFDMHGNVNEWVQDAWIASGYAESNTRLAIDPRGPRSQGWRVTRGGDYFYGPVDARAAARYSASPQEPPGHVVGFRIVAPVHIKRGVPETIAANVRILTGATSERLLQWAKELDEDFLPVTMNPRHGVRPAQFDAIAVPNETRLPWQLHLVDDPEADFQAMWPSHRPAWRMPAERDSGESFQTIFLWIQDSPFWQTWQGSRDFIVEQAGELGLEGFSPGSLFAIVDEQGESWMLTKVPIPGAQTRFLADVTEAELERQMVDFRARGWRPIRLMQHVGFDSPRFAVVFRDNPNRLKWEFDADLNEEEYESRLQQHRAEGIVPTLLASRQQGEEVRYRVVWSEASSD